MSIETPNKPTVESNADDSLHERSASASVIGVIAVIGIIAGAGAMWAYSGSGEVKIEVAEKDKKYTPLPIAKKGPYPAFEIDNLVHAFGSMEYGETGSHTYVVTNKGESTLRLKEGPKSCACTRYEIENSEVAPGESTNIHVEWKPKGPEAVFQQAMNLYTNDPESPRVTLKLGGHVAELLRFIPKKEWDMGNMIGGKEGTANGVIASSLLKEVDLGEITTSHPALKVEVKPARKEDMKTLDAKAGVEVYATLSNDIPAGPFRGYFAFNVRDREYKVDIKAHREGSINFVGTPTLVWDKRRELVDLGQFKAAAGKTARLMLYAKGDDVLEATEIKTKPTYMKCSLEKDPGFPAGKTTRYILEMEVPAGAPSGGFVRDQMGKVSIKTTHPEYPEINIRVKYISLAN